MSANDLVMQRLSDTLAQIHTEMVLTRQQRQRAHADAFEIVSEEASAVNAPAGTPLVPAALMSAPIKVEQFFIYSSSNTASLQFRDNGPKIALPTGITSFRLEIMYGAGDRPRVTDTAANTTNYIRISGVALPSEANPL